MSNEHKEQFAGYLKDATQFVETLNNAVMIFGIVVSTFNRETGHWERRVFGDDISKIIYVSTWRRIKSYLRFLPTRIHWTIKTWGNRNWIKAKRKLYGLFEPSFL